MLTPGAIAVLAVSIGMTITYFILMMPKWNLRLWIFLVVSLMFTAVQLALFFTLPCVWRWYGLLQCLLYDVGAAVQLLLGRRRIRDVMGNR